MPDFTPSTTDAELDPPSQKHLCEKYLIFLTTVGFYICQVFVCVGQPVLIHGYKLRWLLYLPGVCVRRSACPRPRVGGDG